MRKKLIAGNWKMNMLLSDGTFLAKEVSEKVAQHLDELEVVIFPPISILAKVAEQKLKIGVGAQDLAETDKDFGAFTGDVSACMLKDIGAEYTLVGHSERRALHNETDESVNKKVMNAHKVGLKAVVCVGETLKERETGKALDVVGFQIVNGLPDTTNAENTVIAYEPVWAIGTGKVPTLQEIEEVHAYIRKTLKEKFGANVSDKMRILYGGSVKPSNAQDILSLEDVDGALVGGASLKADDFFNIINA